MKNYTIQELRNIKKITQKEVAKEVGVTKDYISLIERGKKNPSDKVKGKLAQIYNVSIVQIFLAIQRTNSTEEKRKTNGKMDKFKPVHENI